MSVPLLTLCLQVCLAETEGLRRERRAYEEKLRLTAEAAKKAELRQLRLEAAAYCIQNAWKCWKEVKAAEAKKAAGAGKGKNGKAGKEAESKKMVGKGKR
jgi:hypothetical protein